MTSVISRPLWSSVYKGLRGECAFTSPVRTECGMFVMCYMQCCSRSPFCSSWMCRLEEVYKIRFAFSDVNRYLDHFKLCVLMVKCMSVVVNIMIYLSSVMITP